MAVLIVTKPTNLEQLGETVRSRYGQSFIEPGLLVEMQKAHDEHYECLESLQRELKKRGIEFYKVSRTKAWPNKGPFSAIFTVGGDGTLLAASHSIDAQAPVIGIRSSLSSVGYLCAGGVQDIPALVKAYVEGCLPLRACARLVAEIETGDDATDRVTHPILNDFLYANVNPAATTRYKLQLGTYTESQKSSGLWIATATGSTAGIHAAGGQVMGAEDRRYQYLVRELYRGEGKDFSLRGGFFDPDEMPLSITNHTGKAMLALDGQRGAIHLKFGDRIIFRRAQSIKVAEPLSAASKPK